MSKYEISTVVPFNWQGHLCTGCKKPFKTGKRFVIQETGSWVMKLRFTVFFCSACVELDVMSIIADMEKDSHGNYIEESL